MGTRTPFLRLEIPSTVPLDNDVLYLNAHGEQQSLRLLPFIKIMPSPASAHNACYFYNRLVDNKRARYVAYHFQTDTDITIDFTDAERDLEAVFPDVFR
jgi:hypothetical protein